MNGYVNFDSKYGLKLYQFIFDDAVEKKIDGLYEYVTNIYSLNKLVVLNNEYVNLVINKMNILDNILLTFSTVSLLISPNDNVRKEG